MRSKRHLAVELLMSHPDDVVAEMLGIRRSTLRRWMKMDDFIQAMREREDEQKASLRRLARQSIVNAATSLCDATVNAGKPDAETVRI